jgi:hypothetical protein
LAFTVTIRVALQLFVLVYVIVAVPAETPVTTPRFVTEATAVLDETHGLVVAAVALPDNVILEPTQTVLFPVIVGLALTVIVAVTEQLLLFV